MKCQGRESIVENAPRGTSLMRPWDSRESVTQTGKAGQGRRQCGGPIDGVFLARGFAHLFSRGGMAPREDGQGRLPQGPEICRLKDWAALQESGCEID